MVSGGLAFLSHSGSRCARDVRIPQQLFSVNVVDIGGIVRLEMCYVMGFGCGWNIIFGSSAKHFLQSAACAVECINDLCR